MLDIPSRLGYSHDMETLLVMLGIVVIFCLFIVLGVLVFAFVSPLLYKAMGWMEDKGEKLADRLSRKDDDFYDSLNSSDGEIQTNRRGFPEK